jgi:hypothetical protein
MPLAATPRDDLASRRVCRANGAVSPLRANLGGVDQASCEDVSVSSRTPVLALCRALIGAGHDSDASLDAYRGETLCLRVRSLAEGAALTVREDTKDGRPRFATYRPGPEGSRSVGGQPQSDFAADPLPTELGKSVTQIGGAVS